MPRPASPLAPVPPALFAALRPLPLAPLQLPLGLLLRRLARHHPGMFARLGEHASRRFGIDPTDLPFAFILAPDPRRAALSVVRRLPARLDVRIAGPLGALVGLVDGDLDGDALFFSRDLAVEGDVEAVLALRNAIDDAGIDLVDEIASLLGPLRPAGARLLRAALRVPERPMQSGRPSWS